MEASTFYSHYSGLRFPRSLPKVRADVKQMILGTSESPSPEGWPSEKGLPLFWQEAKSSRFWKTFFANMGAKLIVDLEAGSGAAAVAAMEAGLSYIGICKSPEHQRVISNVVDSQSLKLITQQGHLLYNATLSESIHQLFKSVAWLFLLRAQAVPVPRESSVFIPYICTDSSQELEETAAKPVEMEGEQWFEADIPQEQPLN